MADGNTRHMQAAPGGRRGTRGCLVLGHNNWKQSHKNASEEAAELQLCLACVKSFRQSCEAGEE